MFGNTLMFKSKDDLNFYLELQERKKNNEITSFNVDSLLSNNDNSLTKYRAKKLMIDEHIFDSKLEAKYYLHLLDLKRENKIKGFELKPKFELLPSFRKNGKTFRKTTYTADFKVFHHDGTIDIVDTKGKETTDFKLKQKMFEYKFPNLSLKVLTYKKTYGGWIEIDEWKKKKRKKTNKSSKKSTLKKK